MRVAWRGSGGAEIERVHHIRLAVQRFGVHHLNVVHGVCQLKQMQEWSEPVFDPIHLEIANVWVEGSRLASS